ncbi:MAG: adenosylcobinamide-GDP ribazoletransferase, partial [Victivallaceae bacterium]|nr:adenosylcobinamide-GDP ribazoletransferase [Victivallaceae bacterium]
KMNSFITTIFRRFFGALTLLTVMPVPGYKPAEKDIAHSKAFFPFVGLLVGIIACGAAKVLICFAPPAITAVIIVILLAAASKGFHLDGLADTADGFFSSRPREQMLEIMRDSRIGSMGVVALITVLGLKGAGFFSLATPDIPSAALFSAVAGRCGMTFYVFISQYAREEGLGKVTFRYKSPLCLIWILAFLAGTGWLLFGNRGLIIAGTVIVFVILWSLYTRRQIGGATGDTLGACEELCEMLIPVILCCL